MIETITADLAGDRGLAETTTRIATTITTTRAPLRIATRTRRRMDAVTPAITTTEAAITTAETPVIPPRPTSETRTEILDITDTVTPILAILVTTDRTLDRTILAALVDTLADIPARITTIAVLA